MIDNLQTFEMKTELLCKGLYLDENLISHYRNQGIEIDYGRKGGAGPSGGKYFIFEDDITLVNVALWNTPGKSDLVLKENKNALKTVGTENKYKIYTLNKETQESNKLDIQIKDLEEQKDPSFFKFNERINEIPKILNELNENKKKWEKKLEENKIGSNCGQYVKRFLDNKANNN